MSNAPIFNETSLLKRIAELEAALAKSRAECSGLKTSLLDAANLFREAEEKRATARRDALELAIKECEGVRLRARKEFMGPVAAGGCDDCIAAIRRALQAEPTKEG